MPKMSKMGHFGSKKAQNEKIKNPFFSCHEWVLNPKFRVESLKNGRNGPSFQFEILDLGPIHGKKKKDFLFFRFEPFWGQYGPFLPFLAFWGLFGPVRPFFKLSTRNIGFRTHSGQEKKGFFIFSFRAFLGPKWPIFGILGLFCEKNVKNGI